MELIAGVTAARLAAGGERTWSEIVAIFDRLAWVCGRCISMGWCIATVASFYVPSP